MEIPPTVDDFRDRDFAGVFADLSDEQVQMLMDDAMCLLGEDPWSGCERCWATAVIYMAMHLYTTLGVNGTHPGTLTTASAGGLSASWATNGGSSSLGSTNWGRQVEALAAGCGRTGPFVVVSPPVCC